RANVERAPVETVVDRCTRVDRAVELLRVERVLPDEIRRLEVPADVDGRPLAGPPRMVRREPESLPAVALPIPRQVHAAIQELPVPAVLEPAVQRHPVVAPPLERDACAHVVVDRPVEPEVREAPVVA